MFDFEWAIERGNATERLHEKVDHGSMRFGHKRYIERAAVRLEQAVSFSFCKAAILNSVDTDASFQTLLRLNYESN